MDLMYGLILAFLLVVGFFSGLYRQYYAITVRQGYS